MAWVRIHDSFTWHVSGQSSVDYKPGVYSVPRRCLEAAVAAGKGKETINPATILRKSERNNTGSPPAKEE